jgi:hypothetical protein
MTAPSTIIELDAPIVPGKSSAGVSIDSDVRNIVAQVKPNAIRDLSGCRLYDFGPVKIWSSADLVSQVGVYAGYQGALLNRIRIGSTISDVEQLFNCEVQEDEEDNLIVPGSSGWCFETEPWRSHRIKENREARITCIFCFAEKSAAGSM